MTLRPLSGLNINDTRTGTGTNAGPLPGPQPGNAAVNISSCIMAVSGVRGQRSDSQLIDQRCEQKGQGGGTPLLTSLVLRQRGLTSHGGGGVSLGQSPIYNSEL